MSISTPTPHQEDSERNHSITRMLKNWREGEQDAVNELIAVAYTRLSKISHNLIQKEHRYLTLQTQGLIHEAYFRFIKLQKLEWRDRQHFFSVWAGIMRRILVDRARAGDSYKRGGSAMRITYSEELEGSSLDTNVDILSLCRALDSLGQENQELSQIVELRYFATLTVQEIAVVLDASPATVKRKWTIAKAWLYRRLTDEQCFHSTQK
ncbi:MAG: sigma-70 family RNA polymerase sigma factor [Gammaproteobacteria bacterium]|nr:sigma-70 family RNA polymerase sigma factor [Gammaproteobacteria bacterium]